MKNLIRKTKIFAQSYFRVLNTGRIKYITVPQSSAEDLPPEKPKYALNLILFAVTFITTSIAGAFEGDTFLESIASGMPYSITLMSILLAHEMGHYLAAKKFGVSATLPYFIPFPSLIGTMGAVIKTKSPIPHRRALLYIGAAGPIAGFVLSLAASVYGISVSEIKMIPQAGPDGAFPVFGDSILFWLIVNFFHGTIPAGYDVFLSPYAWAGWIGFLVTSINLIPIGQLDGGHILYALIGKKQKIVGWIALASLALLSLFWYGWVVWILLTLIVLMIAHPPVPEGPKLTKAERITGWICVLILILTFIPKPVNIII